MNNHCLTSPSFRAVSWTQNAVFSRLVVGLLWSSIACLAQNVTVGPITVSSGTTPYQASNTITTSGSVVIQGSASVVFTAGSSITLLPGFQAIAGTGSPTFEAIIDSAWSANSVTCGYVNNTHPPLAPNMDANDSFTLTITGAASGAISVTETFNGTSVYNNQSTGWTIPADGVFTDTNTQTSSPGVYVQDWFVNGVACGNNPITFTVYASTTTTTTKDYIYLNGKVVAIENHN